MTERRPHAGEKYRHFKNKLYQIIGIAVHSETREELVVYQALYGDFSMYVRPLDMFVSPVDRVKYPEVKQKYRFERVKILEDGSVVSDEAEENVSEKPEEASDGDPAVNPLLMEFFDAEGLEERYRILSAMRDIVDDQMIDSMAVVCDVVIEDGDLMKRYDELKQAIAMRQKYELANRLR